MIGSQLLKAAVCAICCLALSCDSSDEPSPTEDSVVSGTVRDASGTALDGVGIHVVYTIEMHAGSSGEHDRINTRDHLDECDPTPSPFVIEPESEYFCLEVCLSQPQLQICVGPLTEYGMPISSILPGCNHLIPGCDDRPDCPSGGVIETDPWYYVPDASGSFGNWYLDLQVLQEGCICFTFEDIINGDPIFFSATPLDRAVELRWSIVSEAFLPQFLIRRDGDVVEAVEADGSGSYEWTETGLTNGRTYTYELV